jgi:hypothetical protein
MMLGFDSTSANKSALNFFISLLLSAGSVQLLWDRYHDGFSLAVYEPKFRKSLLSIADGSAYPSQRPFLVLLLNFFISLLLSAGSVQLLWDRYHDAIPSIMANSTSAVYEPKFRKSLLSIADGSAYPSQRPFLVLLAMILARKQREKTSVQHQNNLPIDCIQAP